MFKSYSLRKFDNQKSLYFNHSIRADKERNLKLKTSCAGGRHNMPPPPVTLTFDLISNAIISMFVTYKIITVPYMLDNNPPPAGTGEGIWAGCNCV